MSKFDPPSDPFGDVPEGPEPNGAWICLRCGRQKWTYRGKDDDYCFCVICNKPMVWKSDDLPKDAVYCRLCETWVAKSEMKRWTGDDSLHHLCPGCDDDLLPVEKME